MCFSFLLLAVLFLLNKAKKAQATTGEEVEIKKYSTNSVKNEIRNTHLKPTDTLDKRMSPARTMFWRHKVREA